ncbi:hypothetical protein PC119_g13179 [Phytophthora cactorum]|nr:hypothetical protein PC111_g8904 [Phytophthora cactorum]KAG2831299.1 hypothetical protein PC112_g7332 [Phytophthora cactorum]KAG3011627.1 hypothetical protein PC119_g13179 [Phytophthora cactorum]KAG3069376.1 hypothetical protein PC122_g16582 [Phytophthora cactorum]KAG3176784.1 hypothetical protein C6341_g8771 [Phytophthora cactorum]
MQDRHRRYVIRNFRIGSSFEPTRPLIVHSQQKQNVQSQNEDLEYIQIRLPVVRSFEEQGGARYLVLGIRVSPKSCSGFETDVRDGSIRDQNAFSSNSFWHRVPASAMPEFTSSFPRSRHDAPDSDEETKAVERSNVERRRYWLLKLPKTYVPGHRQRYLFMNLDNIASSLLMSSMLYQRIDGATSTRDIYLNFTALTKHLSGNNSATAEVKFQLATYCKTSPFVAHALEKLGWTLELFSNDDRTLYSELMVQLDKGGANANGKTLVLATGDGFLGTTNPNAYREVICKFLKEGWYVEIHAWLYSLNNGYLRLQKENPGCVVVKPLDDVLCDLVHNNKRVYLPSSSYKPPITASNQGGNPKGPENASPAMPVRDARLRNVATQAPSKPSLWPTSLADRLSGTAPIAPAPAVPPPATSWVKVVKEGRTSWSTTPVTCNSPIGSTLGGLWKTPEAASLPTGWRPTAPASTTPFFTSPVSTIRASSERSGLMWSLPVQQMQDLLSSQQADIAMRQIVLQQTAELARILREQDQRFQSGERYPPPRGPHNPWGPG